MSLSIIKILNKINRGTFRCTVSVFLIVCLSINSIEVALAETNLFELATLSDTNFTEKDEASDLENVTSPSDVDKEENIDEENIAEENEEDTFENNVIKDKLGALNNEGGKSLLGGIDENYNSNINTKKGYVNNEVIIIKNNYKAVNVSKLLGAGNENEDSELNEFRNLLDEAEPIIDLGITNDNNESTDKLLGTNEEVAEDSKSILFLHNDLYSTENLIKNLSKLPEVESVEANVVFNANDFYVKNDFVTYDELTKNEDYNEVGGESENDSLLGNSLLGAPSVTPTDFTDKQWNSKEGTGDYQYSIKVASWNDTTYKNTEDLVVAVIDDGIDLDHPDLKNILWGKGDRAEYQTTLGGGKYGYNAVADTTSNDANFVASDPSSRLLTHGTHVAGIIAAEWNGIGVSGVCNGAKILPVKALNDHGVITLQAFLLAYKYLLELKDKGVNIVCVNNSWSGPYASPALEFIVTEAGKHNIASLFSSGNDYLNVDESARGSGALKYVDSALVVDASDKDGVMSSYSNYGKLTTDITAPGTDILSCINTKLKTFSPPITGIEPLYRSGYFTGQEDNDFFPLTDTVFGDDIAFVDTRYRKELGYARGFLLVQASTVSNAKIKFVSKGFSSGYSSSKLYLQCAFALFDGIMLDYDIMIPVKECDASGTITGTEVFDFKVASASSYIRANNINSPYVDLNAIYTYDDGGTHYCKAYLGDETDKFYFWVIVRGYNNESGLSIPSYYFLVGDPSIYGNDPVPYNYMSGTSMACPTACGALAVIAKHYSSATPSEWLSYLKGSVSSGASALPSGNTGRLITYDNCMSGGIVNLKNALAGITSPVITSFNLLDNSTSNYKYEINGFFFGSATSNISVGGKSLSAAITSWTDKKIIFETTENLGGDNVEVKVTRTDSKWGRNFYNINENLNDNTYVNLPLYDGLSDNDIKLFKGCQLLGAIATASNLITFALDVDRNYYLFIYDINTKLWSKKDLNMIGYSYTDDYYTFSSNIVANNGAVYALCYKTDVASKTYAITNYLFKYDISSKNVSFTNITFSDTRHDYIRDTILYIDNDANNTMYLFGGTLLDNTTKSDFISNYIYKIDVSGTNYVVSPTAYTLPKVLKLENATKVGNDKSGNKCLYLYSGYTITSGVVSANYSIIKVIFNSDGSISTSTYDSDCASIKCVLNSHANPLYINVKNGCYIVAGLDSNGKNVYKFDVPKKTVTSIGNVTLGNIQFAAGDSFDGKAYVLADSVFTEGVRVFKTFDTPDFDPESPSPDPVVPSSGGGSGGGGGGSIGLEFQNSTDLPTSDPTKIVAYDNKTAFEFDPFLNKFRFSKTDENGFKSYITNKWVSKTNDKGKKEVYLTDESGLMVTGYAMKDGKLYYMSTDNSTYGQMQTGFVNINGQIIYFDKTGAFADDPKKAPILYNILN